MTLKSLVDIVDTCPPDDGWGCAVTNDITLNGVPYAPFSKGDKLGRVADWTDGKDRDGRSRGQYNRNFRGKSSHHDLCQLPRLYITAANVFFP